MTILGSLDCTLVVAARLFEFAEGFVCLPTQAIQSGEWRRYHMMGRFQCPCELFDRDTRCVEG